MKSWFLQGAKFFDLVELEQLPFDESIVDSLKIRIINTSVSHSDLVTYNGVTSMGYPIIPGRSATGLVSESNLDEYKKGQRVFLSSNESAGLRGVVLNGYLSDYSVIPLENIHLLPEGLGDKQAIFIEDIAFGIRAIEKLDIQKTNYIAIFGASALSCIVGQLAIYYQAIPIVIDTDSARLEVAEDCGIYYTINPNDEDAYQRMIEITGGTLADYGFFDSDCFGSGEKILHLLAKGGKLCVVGQKTDPTPIKIELNKLLERQMTVFGINSCEEEISTAINLLAMHAVKVDNLIKEQCKFEDVPEFFEKISQNQNFFKIIVNC